jgi:orotidine-5'-phosphate decarboxylase
MKDKSPIILALDTPDVTSAMAMIDKTLDFISIYKLGLEFFLAHGKTGVSEIQRKFPDVDIFLDLKLHDIPNTVAGASLSIAELHPRFLTVHAAGGTEMVRAAAKNLPMTSITAVTVLTSLGSEELLGLGLPSDPTTLAISLAERALLGGATSIVCSPHEAATLRHKLGTTITIITPGVRPKNSSHDDQNRVMTPREAINQGANYVVIGRPITQASSPHDAAKEIRNSLE